MSNESQLLSSAIGLAADMHGGQVDKSGEPYILHPIRVMQIARDRGLPPYIQRAAVMHDVLEDTAILLDELIQFDAEAAVAVRVITKMEGEKYDAFIDRISHATDDIIRLKLCDLHDNTASWRLVTTELQAMAKRRYAPAIAKLEQELVRRQQDGARK